MTARATIRAVAFDLFHTLVDPEDFRPKEFRRAPAVAELLGLPLPEFERAWAADHAARIVSDQPTEERLLGFCERFGVRADHRRLIEARDLLGRYTTLAILNPRRSTLDALTGLRERGVRLGLVSNCDPSEIGAWSDSVMAPLFDATVFSCEVGFAKPALEAYRALVPRWKGIPLSEAIYVGDGNHDELVGARRAGFARVVFQAEFVSHNGLRSDEANARFERDADVTIRSLHDVRDLAVSPVGPG
jgi:putative hydrolase of the HAD superfamily